MNSFHDTLTRIRIAETRAQRKPLSVQLLAVSKHQSIDAMIALYEQGQRLFGENYLQEALDKQQCLKNFSIEWHFIGHIQRNKTKLIAEHFSWVQSVANELIAKRLNEARPLHLPALNICIEVNIDNEAQKSGVLLADLPVLAHFIQSQPRLCLRGLMIIPKADSPPQRTFQKLKTAFDALNQQGFNLDTLSMGMSADFELTIQEGSTMVRLGTALFPGGR